ncbi:MAG: IPTL-CTERM sorting domain-containing protein [Thermoanaerobaculia bacterium]
MKVILPIAISLAMIAAAGGPVNAQCPAVGQDTGCGVIITVTDSGASVAVTGQGPYDGADDTLVGVVNNSSLPVSALGVASGIAVFAFDGDGLVSYGISGNPRDSTGYGGPNAYFTNINAAQTSGMVNFITPIPAGGGMGYFSLENAITAATSCSSIINNSVMHVASGPNIDASFTPNLGFNLQQAAQYCNFTNFDWLQKITHQDNPSMFFARNIGGAFDATIHGPVNLSSSRVPYSDPPPGGGYTYSAAPDNSYPFYYDVATELLGHETGGFTLTFHDAPGDGCLPGGSSAGTPDCNNMTEPAGSFGGYMTHLAGVKADGTAVDLKIGFTWTSDFNGTTGGVHIKKTDMPADPGSGTGGVTITSVNNITDYEYNGFVITTVNGGGVGVQAIPTLSDWGLIVLALLLIASAMRLIAKSRRPQGTLLEG